MLVGCSTQRRHQWLTFFFDGVPAPVHHGGGLPPGAPARVEDQPLTLGLLQSKLPEYRPIPGYEFISVEPGSSFKVGNLGIDAVAMSHVTAAEALTIVDDIRTAGRSLRRVHPQALNTSYFT